MTNNAQKIAEEIDFVTEGFKRVPVAERPPHVKWGEEFHAWDINKQNIYLMKFSEAMNHAAATIQEERNRLGQLVELKEGQLNQMKAMLDANNRMLQSEITKINEERQEYNKHVAKLNARIRELEKG